MRTKKIKGKHFILDIYGCDYHEIDSAPGLEKLMTDAANAAHMEILHVYMHKFAPHGVTGVVVLSTSHISVHTWPEYGYAAFDVFSCSNDAQTRLAVNHIVKNLQHSRKRVSDVDRGYAELKTIHVPIYKDNTRQPVNVLRKLAEIRSPFQNIQVLDLEGFGRTMLIDGITQVSVSDTHIYDEAITKHVPTEGAPEVLILGGGDGFVARHILAMNPRAKITIAELDPEVVYCARTYFDQKEVFEHPNVTLVIGDAMQFLAVCGEKERVFDTIIVDLTDEPVGSGRARAKLLSFYEKLVGLAVPVLKEGGWISSQAGVRKAKAPLVTTYEVLEPVLKSTFARTEEEQTLIPSFLEKNVFLHAKKGA